MTDQKTPRQPSGENGGKNEGEGNRTAAREYNEAQQRFAKSGKVDEKAREAEEALERDRRELERAETIGRKHERAEDPAITRKP